MTSSQATQEEPTIHSPTEQSVTCAHHRVLSGPLHGVLPPTALLLLSPLPF